MNPDRYDVLEMNQTLIKICGLTKPADARVAVESGADFIGLVFVPASPRFISREQARDVVHAVGGAVECVGVFKDETLDEIKQLIDSVPLDRVQLHGSSQRFTQMLAPTPTVLATRFDMNLGRNIADADALCMRMSHIAGLLIDTPDPTGLGGGTGTSFDWNALAEILSTTPSNPPIFLAGGLTAKNVARAITTLRPAGVDVSSGVEISRGIKDPDKIRAFCHAVRDAESD